MDHVDSQHIVCQDAVRKIRLEGQHLRATPQNFMEFWNVSTRPTNRNGLGRSTTEANNLLEFLEQLFPVLLDSSTIYAEWRRLVVEFNVSGVQVHDARLVAAMLVHDITHILTFNTSDFTRYKVEGIVPVNPNLI